MECIACVYIGVCWRARDNLGCHPQECCLPPLWQYLSCTKNSPIRLAVKSHGVLQSLPPKHGSIRMLYHISQSYLFCNSNSGYQVYVTSTCYSGAISSYLSSQILVSKSFYSTNTYVCACTMLDTYHVSHLFFLFLKCYLFTLTGF